MRCIAVINQKGGVGKTTSTVNIGAALASRGNKVLLLDIDPQANLTLHLDRRPEADGPTMTNMLVDGTPLTEMIIQTCAEDLYMVPADTSLSGVETMLANRIGRETILGEAIEALDTDETAISFDYILLDCPPSLGVLAANALVAADDIIIPMQAEYFSMQGMTKLMEVMQLVKQRLNPKLAICLILPCMVDRRTNLTNEVLSELRQHFGDVLSETCIRSNVKLAEAPSFGRTIFEHAPESNGAHDYAIVADELLRRFAGTFEPAPLEEDEDEDEGEDEELALEADDPDDDALENDASENDDAENDDVENDDVEPEESQPEEPEPEPEPTPVQAVVSTAATTALVVVRTEAPAEEAPPPLVAEAIAPVETPAVASEAPELPDPKPTPTEAASPVVETPAEPAPDASIEEGAPFVESVTPAEAEAPAVEAPPTPAIEATPEPAVDSAPTTTSVVPAEPEAAPSIETDPAPAVGLSPVTSPLAAEIPPKSDTPSPAPELQEGA